MDGADIISTLGATASPSRPGIQVMVEYEYDWSPSESSPGAPRVPRLEKRRRLDASCRRHGRSSRGLARRTDILLMSTAVDELKWLGTNRFPRLVIF
jgi:hypothetical protein